MPGPVVDSPKAKERAATCPTQIPGTHPPGKTQRSGWRGGRGWEPAAMGAMGAIVSYAKLLRKHHLTQFYSSCLAPAALFHATARLVKVPGPVVDSPKAKERAATCPKQICHEPIELGHSLDWAKLRLHTWHSPHL